MITKLKHKLKTDNDLYFAYQSNIAMSFIDCYDRFRNRRRKSPNRDELFEIANTAARQFLELLIK